MNAVDDGGPPVKSKLAIDPACTLPLTGVACIDMVITDLCVLEMDATQQRFQLTELAPDVTTDEVLKKTAADIGINLA